MQKRKTVTSSEVKNRWNAKTYKRYTVGLRRDTEADLIDFIEAHRDTEGVTYFLRLGIEAHKKNEGE